MLISRLITETNTHYDEVVGLMSETYDKRARDQRADLITAIQYLYDLKKKLKQLHPSVLPIIEGMLKTEC